MEIIRSKSYEQSNSSDPYVLFEQTPSGEAKGKGWAIFLIIVFVLLALALVLWIVLRLYRHRKDSTEYQTAPLTIRSSVLDNEDDLETSRRSSMNRMSGLSGRSVRSVRSRISVHAMYDDLPVSVPTELDFGGQKDGDDQRIAGVISAIGTNDSFLNHYDSGKINESTEAHGSTAAENS